MRTNLALETDDARVLGSLLGGLELMPKGVIVNISSDLFDLVWAYATGVAGQPVMSVDVVYQRTSVSVVTYYSATDPKGEPPLRGPHALDSVKIQGRRGAELFAVRARPLTEEEQARAKGLPPGGAL